LLRVTVGVPVLVFVKSFRNQVLIHFAVAIIVDAIQDFLCAWIDPGFLIIAIIVIVDITLWRFTGADDSRFATKAVTCVPSKHEEPKGLIH
jgi:hypothetical protein